jgi:hypothetical protein
MLRVGGGGGEASLERYGGQHRGAGCTVGK